MSQPKNVADCFVTQIYGNLNFGEQLKKIVKKTAQARSNYLLGHQTPLIAHILVLKPNVLSHSLFSATSFFKIFLKIA